MKGIHIMRHLLSHISIAILTFIIGASAASLWLIYSSPATCPMSGNLTPLPISRDSEAQKEESQPQFVGLTPIARLIANPKDFHGKRVQVTGFVHLEFEGNGIYAHQDDYEYSLYGNGLWLSIPRDEIDNYVKYNDSYVTVEGIFNANKKGHLGFWTGSIENITMFKRWAKVRGRR